MQPEKDTLGIEGKRKIAYLLPETMQTRRQRSNIFEALKEKKVSSLNSTHSKSIFKKPQRLYRHTKAKKKSHQQQLCNTRNVKGSLSSRKKMTADSNQDSPKERRTLQTANMWISRNPFPLYFCSIFKI